MTSKIHASSSCSRRSSALGRPARSLRIAAVVALGILLALSLAAKPVLASSSASHAHGAVQPTAAALDLAALVRGRWLGIDHGGNLWAWEATEGSVRFFSPSGERVGTLVLPQDTQAVDGDAQWGAVALTDEGNRLVWLRAGTQPKSSPPAPVAPAAGDSASAGAAKKEGTANNEIRLSEPYGWVCWIDEHTVALSPQRGTHRVELWSLRTGKMVKSFGTETAITLARGATRVREVELRYDAGRRLLYTLESYDGTLEVFTLDGKLAWQAKLADPYQKVEQSTLAELDDRAKARNMNLGRTLSDLWLAVSADGTAWVSQRIDVLNQKVTLAKVTAAGTTMVEVPKLRCPSRTFTVWGDRLVFFRDISSPREVCNSVAPLP